MQKQTCAVTSEAVFVYVSFSSLEKIRSHRQHTVARRRIQIPATTADSKAVAESHGTANLPKYYINQGLTKGFKLLSQAPQTDRTCVCSYCLMPQSHNTVTVRFLPMTRRNALVCLFILNFVTCKFLR